MKGHRWCLEVKLWCTSDVTIDGRDCGQYIKGKFSVIKSFFKKCYLRNLEVLVLTFAWMLVISSKYEKTFTIWVKKLWNTQLFLRQREGFFQIFSVWLPAHTFHVNQTGSQGMDHCKECQTSTPTGPKILHFNSQTSSKDGKEINQ